MLATCLRQYIFPFSRSGSECPPSHLVSFAVLGKLTFVHFLLSSAIGFHWRLLFRNCVEPRIASRTHGFAVRNLIVSLSATSRREALLCACVCVTSVAVYLGFTLELTYLDNHFCLYALIVWHHAINYFLMSSVVWGLPVYELLFYILVFLLYFQTNSF